jgi:hypothetical protein
LQWLRKWLRVGVTSIATASVHCNADIAPVLERAVVADDGAGAGSGHALRLGVTPGTECSPAARCRSVCIA